MEDAEARFAALQARLAPLLSGPEGERVLVVVPSISLDPELVEAHARQLPVLEERFLFLLFLLRTPRFRVAYVNRSPLPDGILDYYLGLMPGVATEGRLEILSVDEQSSRPLAAALLDRPDLLQRIRDSVAGAGHPAMIVFSAREPERDLALALDVPLYAPDHRFERYGRKSGGREVFAAAGVPHPRGVANVRTAADVAAAVKAIGASAVVVKHDDSVYGEGNAILRGADPRTLPDAYLAALARQGGVVEELIEAEEVRSPSVQMRIIPAKRPAVISTHDQILGGAGGQQFVGCRCPADPAYGPLVAREAEKVAAFLQERGVVGRFGVDFVVARRRGGEWDPYAIEINLREGGTSHPIGSMWLLTGGEYEPAAGFRTPGGEPRFYRAADFVGEPAWHGMPARRAIAAVREAGLEWDPARQTGAVLHMLRGLELDGRISITAVGDAPQHADAIYDGVLDAISRG